MNSPTSEQFAIKLHQQEPYFNRVQRGKQFDDSDEGYGRVSAEEFQFPIDDDDDDDSDDDSMFRYETPSMYQHDYPTRRGRNKSKYKTKLVTFYRNGDKHFKGLTLPVNYRNFSTWETLLIYLGDKIALPYGVRNIYTVNGDPIHDISELDDGRGYVCASGQYISTVPYGRVQNLEKYWTNRQPTAGLRKTDKILFKRDQASRRNVTSPSRQPIGVVMDSANHGNWAKPRAIVVVSNTNRDSKSKILLNPRTTQSFEHVLKDMSQAIKLLNPPIKQLFTWKTEERVLSFSQLYRDFKDHDVFIACGLEPLRKIQVQSDSSCDSEKEGAYNNIQDTSKPLPLYINNNYNDQRPMRKAKRRERDEQKAYPTFLTSEETPRGSSEDDMLPPIKHAFTRSTEDVSIHPRRTMLRRSTFKVSRSQAQFPVLPNEFQTQPDEVPLEETTRDMPRSKDTSQLINPQPTEHVQSDSELKDDDGYFQAKQMKPVNKWQRGKNASIGPSRISIHGHIREFHPPSGTRPRNSNTSPNKKLKLDWVYGYRGFDSGRNLFVLSSTELVYYVGAVAVLYNRVSHSQRHYVGHNEDIQCMAIHPLGNYIATGQKQGHLPESTPPDVILSHTAHVRVWEMTSLCTHAIIGLECFDVGISSLSFSNENDGRWLLIVDSSENHMLSVWEWNEDTLLAQNVQSQTDMVVVADFHPHDDAIIVTAGKQHLYFWTIDNNRILRDKRSGIFEGEHPKYITCLAFSPTGDVIVGDATGNITIWEKDKQSGVFCMQHKIQHAHERSLHALCMLEDGTLLSGGGLDRRLLAWDSMRGYVSVKVERLFPESAGGIRAIAPVTGGGADGIVVLGTTKNNIMIGSLQTKFNYILQGHSEELWALDTHPSEPFFVTAGYDTFVMLWSAELHKLIWKVNVEKPCLSCAFYPTGAIIAVGTTVGRFVILHAANGMHMTSVQVGSDKLDAIKFSPDGSMLVMGSHDHKIYIFAVMDDGQVYRKVSALQGHGNFLTHIDWSVDNLYLQSVSGNYDLLYWDLQEMKQERANAIMRDMSWETQNCILGYSVMGVWPSRDRGTDINTVDRSNKKQLLVAGDNYGFVSMFTYPCTSVEAKSHEFKHHSSHVTTTKFLFDDKFLISSGGVDAVLLQWSVTDKNCQLYDSI